MQIIYPVNSVHYNNSYLHTHIKSLHSGCIYYHDCIWANTIDNEDLLNLFQSCADYDKIGLIHYFASINKIDIFHLLLSNYQYDLAWNDNILLKIAVTNNSDKILEYLLNNGVNVTSTDNFAIKVASSLDNNSLEILINYGADLTVDNNTPIKISSGIIINC